MKGLVALFLFAVSGAALAGADAWCTFDPDKLTPEQNLPAWVCDAATKAALHEQYSIHTGMNPFFLAGTTTAMAEVTPPFGSAMAVAKSWELQCS